MGFAFSFGLGQKPQSGSGILPATAPDAPTSLTATAVSDTQIDLSWTVPESDGRSAIIGYKIERESPIDGGFSTLIANTSSTDTTYSMTGLTGATEYNTRVSAINTIGTSDPSNEDNATTWPTGPFLFTTGADDAAVGTLAWTTPENALADDSSNAIGPANTGTTHYLKVTGPTGVSSLPDSASITQIRVDIERRDIARTSASRDSEVKLVVGGSVQSDNQGELVATWPSSMGVRTYTFAVSLTGAQFKASDFGVVLSALIFNSVQVDYIRVKDITAS